MFIRRLGSSATAVLPCSGGNGCPDILELDSGDFAVIGTDITTHAINRLPVGSGCGDGERVVQIPCRLLVAARGDIPLAA